ncbi:hypothetical protein EV426DRAFT_113220 [Tirmania nivea]|nr:hypothetical protein EV426DRAFT_113220 [Tirmania nivea]
MESSRYPDSQRRAYNHTPGDLDQDEGGASLLPFGAPQLLSPSPFPRLESPRREEEFVTQVHDEDEYESPYVGRAETTEGDLSMPVEHVRHLLDMDSSFKANEEGFDDEDLEQQTASSPPQEDYLDKPEEDEPEPESPLKGKKTPATSPLKGTSSFRKAVSSFGQEDEEDFDDFSMIHPEQTPSLKSRKSFFRSIIVSNTNSPSALRNVSNSNKFKQLGDMPPPPLPPLSRINSRSTQRRLERSYAHTPSDSKSRSRNIESIPNLSSPESFEMSSPLPQHQPSSDTEFAPSSPIISAQTRRKLQKSYGSDKQESPVERPPLSGRLHRSESTTSTRSTGRKPKFLRSRQSSTRSSISSVHSNAYKNDEQEDDEKEDNVSTLLGAKTEKLGKGKAREGSPIKEDIRGRNVRKDSLDRYLSEERDGSRDFYDSKGDMENFGGPLSRTTSLGSIASGVTGLASMVAETTGGPVKMGSRAHLDPVTEVKSGVDDDGKGSDDGLENPPLPPETALGPDTDSEYGSDVEPEKVPLPQESPIEPRTPKQKPRLPNPSMTAISARVSEIQIPATVAKEFYARENRPYPASTTKLQLERYSKQETKTPGKDMTLKEQNAVIDKLHKQVFDLKLRCFFLDQKLQNTSEEGMDSLRKENVDLKVQLAGAKKELKVLKRQIKELKAAGAKGTEDDTEGEDGEHGNSAGNGVEIYELRERCERYEVEIERLKRKIELDAVVTSGQPVDDVVDIMKEMVENARLQTEKTNAHNEELMKEVEQLKRQLSAQQESNNSLQLPSVGRRPSTISHSDAGSSNITATSSLRVSNHQNINTADIMDRLRAENDELRRENGAQTSMLTTRNKERDQLYQEIEELKLNMRSHGSLRTAGSSASMADQLGLRFQHLHHGDGTERSTSRNSFAGSSTVLAEEERENMENVNGALRDKISELKIAKADLELQLGSAIRELQEMDISNEQRQLAYEQEITLLTNNQRDLEDVIGDLTRERDELLGLYEQKSIDFDDLRDEAEEELERLEIQIITLREEVEEYKKALTQKIDDCSALQEDYDALQREIRDVSDHAVAMEDKAVVLQKKVNELEQEKADLEQEIERAEKKFREEEANSQRLNVQLESAQGQITFLNEELDGDKIKIGQLETNLNKVEEQVREERERAKDWERRCGEEKRRTEKERERRTGDSEGVKELEKRLTEREKDIFQKDDEVRRLRKTIAKREGEAQQWRDRLEEVEGALREALGDVTGTKENLLESITRLQAQLDATLEELDSTKRRLGERERTLRDRESMLETMALETKKLSEILEKERNDRKQTKKEVDNLENKNQHHRQKLSQSEIQYKELERTRNREVRNFQNDENKLREQISERNALLVAVWSRISVLPGPEFAHRHSHVTTAVAVAGTQQGKLSMESAVAQAFVAFSRHMMNGVKAVETVIAQFKTKVKQVDRDLMKEYQLLESALESRTRRLERLETMVRGGLGESAAVRTEVAKLRTENRLLRAEMVKLSGNVTGTPPQQVKEAKRKSVVQNVERLSQVFDAAVNKSDNSNVPTNSGGTGSSSSNNGPESTQRAANTTPIHTTEKITTKSTTSKARELIAGAFTRSSKPPAVTATPPPAVNNKSTPVTPQSRPATSTAATNTSVIVTDPQDDAQAAGEPGDGTDPVTQKRWIHRLRELERRLKSEREARIIDRSGAKRRIEEELQEKEALRKELEREKERWSSLGVPEVEGVKERLSIEDVKRDDQSPQQATQHPQPTASQHANTNVSNTGSVRGRQPRERRGSVPLAGAEHKPRKSSRSRHRAPAPILSSPSSAAPIAGPSSEGGAGVSRPRGPNPEEQEFRSQSMRERGVSRSHPPLPEGFTQDHNQGRRERGVSRHRGANGQEETREERRERKEREREERRIRKEREGAAGGLKGDKREAVSPVNSGSGL